MEGTIDTQKLTHYVRPRLPGFAGPIALEVFAGGQSNPTFLLHAGDRRYVLRKKPAGDLLAGAHAIDREYRVMKSLQDTGVPVPRIH